MKALGGIAAAMTMTGLGLSSIGALLAIGFFITGDLTYVWMLAYGLVWMFSGACLWGFSMMLKAVVREFKSQRVPDPTPADLKALYAQEAQAMLDRLSEGISEGGWGPYDYDED